MREVEILFRTAVRHHQSGRLTDAERCYRQILMIDAQHVDCLHLLGIIASQTGRHEEAIDLIGHAIRLRNDVPSYHNNLGNLLKGQGRHADAATCYQRALDLKPDYADAHNNLGNTFWDQGNLVAAVSHYECAVALKPDFTEAHNNLGNALGRQGKLAAAVARYEQALALRPDFAEAHNNLGNVLEGQGKLAEATLCYQRALTFRPDFAEAHFNLGNALKSQGHAAEAVIHYKRAVVLKPGFAEAHYNLGNLFRDQGSLSDAMDCYERAILARPDYAEAHNNLGNLALSQSKPLDAMTHYERAVGLKSDYPEAYYNMGNALQSMGKLTRAVTCYERALTLKPDFAGARHNLGNVFLDQGKLEEARQAYEEAIGLAPKSGRFYRSLVNVRRIRTGDHQLAAMERLARDKTSLPLTDQIELHFALSKAYSDLEQYERSFSHLLEGNALRRRELGYDEPTTLGTLDRIRTVFTSNLLNGKQGAGDPSPTPIFIVGMLRSGTTLIEQILASHPKVFGAGELRHLSHLAASLKQPDSVLQAFPEIVADLPAERLRQLGTSYVNAVNAMAPEAERVIDKMPGNFALVGLIHLALPNARIIHMRRDPIDTCLSCFSILFTNGQPYSYDLAELGRYYRAYEAVMEHWRQVLPTGAMLEVRYEDVVADLERQARQVVAHCGLEWDDACLAFHETRRTVRTASATQVRQPIYRSSIGRWRPYRKLLRPLITELGLTDETSRIAKP